MANRKVPFVNGEYYHIYNRGIDKRNIFSNQNDLGRFLRSMVEFNTIKPIGSIYENSFNQLGGSTSKLKKRKKKLVNFIAYCLNPNHYHLIIEQISEKGIEKFMHRLGTGYTMYFNEKEKRSGSLFQGRFKSIHIDSNEYILHLSAYVNLNYRVHQLGGSTSKLVKSQSSWGEYTGEKDNNICNKGIVLGQFADKKEYAKFSDGTVRNIISKRYELSEIENLLLE